MHTINQQLILTLKNARVAKKLSQRELADKLGIPQSHLSKIETGQVNIKLASFVEMARHLEFEVMLVPRQEVMFVKSFHRPEVKPVYTLDDDTHED